MLSPCPKPDVFSQLAMRLESPLPPLGLLGLLKHPIPQAMSPAEAKELQFSLWLQGEGKRKKCPTLEFVVSKWGSWSIGAAVSCPPAALPALCVLCTLCLSLSEHFALCSAPCFLSSAPCPHPLSPAFTSALYPCPCPHPLPPAPTLCPLSLALVPILCPLLPPSALCPLPLSPSSAPCPQPLPSLSPALVSTVCPLSSALVPTLYPLLPALSKPFPAGLQPQPTGCICLFLFFLTC